MLRAIVFTDESRILSIRRAAAESFPDTGHALSQYDGGGYLYSPRPDPLYGMAVISPGYVRREWTRFLEGGRFKPAAAILGLLRESGIDPDSEIVPYCHRGARSANTYYASSPPT